MNEVSINKQTKLSEHFTLGELTKTKHVTADGNIPPQDQLLASLIARMDRALKEV